MHSSECYTSIALQENIYICGRYIPFQLTTWDLKRILLIASACQLFLCICLFWSTLASPLFPVLVSATWRIKEGSTYRVVFRCLGLTLMAALQKLRVEVSFFSLFADTYRYLEKVGLEY